MQGGMMVTNYIKQRYGVLFYLNQGRMFIKVCSSEVIRVFYTPEDNFPPKASLSVKKQMREEVKFEVEKTQNTVIVKTKNLILRVNTENSGLSFEDKAGTVLLRELEENNKIMTRHTVEGEDCWQCRCGFESPEDEAIYGLGQFHNNLINLKGLRQELWQCCMQIAVPFIISSKGYGLLWDNASRSVFDSTGNKVVWESEVADSIDYYFISGNSPDEIIASYRALTGRAPLFPKWAYGLFHSKNRYATEEELIGTIREFRHRGLPVDTIVQDWHYWGNSWGSHNFDPARYPDPRGMIRKVHDEYSAKLMISVWPQFYRDSDNYDELDTNGCLYEIPEPYNGCRIYDAFNPHGRKLYWKQMKEKLYDIGIDGWWLDATEPEMSFEDLHSAETYLGKGAKYINAYPLMTTEAVYEGQRQVTEEKRVFILTRSAFLGQQRNSAASWSGDIESNWESYRAQIPAGLNFCMAGIPYWTTDIGGYLNWSVENKAELFLRWFQYGTFCPIFRVHGMEAKELWQFGKEAEEILLTYDKLRYRLMPYIYSMAWMVTDKGYTMMRGLFMDFPDDKEVRDITDQFMFGSAMMICPVTEEAAESRLVYLPMACGWYDFWTGKLLEGGRVIKADAPLEKMPVFVKAGSMLVMGPDLQYTDEKIPDPLEIRIYQGGDCEFTLYEDEGDNYNYEKGFYTVIKLHYDDVQKLLTISERRGAFKGALEKRTFNIRVVSPNNIVGEEAIGDIVKKAEYNGTEIKVKL